MTNCSYEDVRRLQQEVGCSEALAWVLVRRGILDGKTAKQWLEPPTEAEEAAGFHDPMLLGDMAAAVERIRYAIRHKEPIVVHGDYDADGVCSTTLITEALEALGAEVRPFLPSRFSNGYGLHIDSVDRFALDGVRLIITVDCGITAVEPIAQAVDRGMDVIVCDHHQPCEELPAAIICSTRPSDYPFVDLCAAGVAGKLVQALGAPYGDAQHELEAIATIADVVPLLGENRHIVRRGLRALRRTNRPGLRALLSTCNLHAADVTPDDIAFKIAPRINAVGRLRESEAAYELLRADTPERATAGAELLHQTNHERKRIELSIVDQAIAQVESFSDSQRDARAYVVSGRDWHEGVVGIVASRLVERYNRPVIVISEQDPLARGSGRSIAAFNLHKALHECSHILTRWGGHSAAAGLTIDPTRINEFRAAFGEYANSVLTERDLERVENVDAVVAGDELSMALAEQIESLAPFGHGNPRPRFMAVGVKAADVRCVGEDSRHVQCTLTTGGVTAKAIGFGMSDEAAMLNAGASFDAAVQISVNRYRGRESLQLQIDSILPWQQTPNELRSCHDNCVDTFNISALSNILNGEHALASVDSSRLPALEPLLIRPTTVDLRHANRAGAHVARLAGAGQSLLVVCIDVQRRRRLLDSILNIKRFGSENTAVVSEFCTEVAIKQIVRKLAGRDHPPAITMCDFDALPRLINAGIDADSIVVLDPPVVEIHRDVLAVQQLPLHLVFGATEERYALAVASSVADLRTTFAAAWRSLVDGHQTFAAVAEMLRSADPVPSQAAVAHALHSLQQRGLIHVDQAQQIVTATQSSSPSLSPPLATSV